LVFICKNTIKYANIHLNEYIAKIAKRHITYSNPIQKNAKKGERVSTLSSDNVNRIFINYSIYLPCNYHIHNINYKFRKRIAYFIFNSVKII